MTTPDPRDDAQSSYEEDIMENHFNKLTPAEAERLTMLAEECAEVIQVVGKILRHGYDNYHPDDPSRTNRDLLARELTDVDAIKRKMTRNELKDYAMNDVLGVIWEKMLLYTHHEYDSEINEGASCAPDHIRKAAEARG